MQKDNKNNQKQPSIASEILKDYKRENRSLRILLALSILTNILVAIINKM